MDPQAADWVARARAGDARALRWLIERLGDELLAFVSFLLRGDRSAAQEVVQDLFVRLWHQLPQLTTLDHVRAWCFRVARCRAASHVRQTVTRQRRLRLAAQGRARAGFGGRHAVPAEEVREPAPQLAALRRALDQLPFRYRAPVRLHYLQGLGTQATARLLGLTLSTTKMRLLRARELLRRSLCDPPPLKSDNAPPPAPELREPWAPAPPPEARP